METFTAEGGNDGKPYPCAHAARGAARARRPHRTGGSARAEKSGVLRGQPHAARRARRPRADGRHLSYRSHDVRPLFIGRSRGAGALQARLRHGGLRHPCREPRSFLLFGAGGGDGVRDARPDGCLARGRGAAARGRAKDGGDAPRQTFRSRAALRAVRRLSCKDGRSGRERLSFPPAVRRRTQGKGDQRLFRRLSLLHAAVCGGHRRGGGTRGGRDGHLLRGQGRALYQRGGARIRRRLPRGGRGRRAHRPSLHPSGGGGAGAHGAVRARRVLRAARRRKARQAVYRPRRSGGSGRRLRAHQAASRRGRALPRHHRPCARRGEPPRPGKGALRLSHPL